MAKTLNKVTGSPEISRQDVLAALETWWDEHAEQDANDPLAVQRPEGSVLNIQPAIDSLAAVEALLVLEELLGKEAPVTLVKSGGYQSREEFLDDLVSNVVEHFPEVK